MNIESELLDTRILKVYLRLSWVAPVVKYVTSSRDPAGIACLMFVSVFDINARIRSNTVVNISVVKRMYHCMSFVSALRNSLHICSITIVWPKRSLLFSKSIPALTAHKSAAIRPLLANAGRSVVLSSY